ncbi:MAG: DUF1294 domain-containing protein [Oscillospiraceae bacterium]|nr:DUF1294 domain-containing protein [Oscillospiraceae bacterium]
MKLSLVFAFYLVLLSLIAFILYGSDKRKAKTGAWRTKESVLLGVGLIGGAAGALLGMKAFRHKTKHWYFWVVNTLGLVLQLALLLLLWRKEI